MSLIINAFEELKEFSALPIDELFLVNGGSSYTGSTPVYTNPSGSTRTGFETPRGPVATAGIRG